ncbi:MAG: hypothetical protein BWX54_01745 [Verrucomicrobia bacterium ADurb.Bin018]|nr:MAG: hypothetical protein BWX54_01745 [Verrucomicrobia bacterium ADurb.Bin018]
MFIREAEAAQFRQHAQHGRVGATRVAALLGELVGRHSQRAHARRRREVANSRVIQQPAAGFYFRRKFFQRWPVHRHQHVRFRYHRRAHRLAGEHHAAIGGAAALLGAVGGIPRHKLAGAARRASQNHAHAQHALAAKTRHLDFPFWRGGVQLGIRRLIRIQPQQAVEGLLAVIALAADNRLGLGGAVAENPQRIFRLHLLGDEPRGGFHVHFLVGGAGHEHFHECVALAVALDFQRLADGLPALPQLGHVGERHPRNVHRRLQLVDQLRHVQRVAHLERVAPLRGGFRFLAHQRGRRHLAAGHAIHRIIDEKHGQFFAAVGGLQGFVEADGCQIAIALIRADHRLVHGAGEPGGHRRRTAVGHLDVARIKIIIAEHRAADGADHHGSVLQVQVGQRLADQLMQHAVLATGAVVGGGQRRIALAGEDLVEAAGFDHFFHGCLRCLMPAARWRAPVPGFPPPSPDCRRAG